MGEDSLKSVGAIRQKIRQVAYRHLKRKMALLLDETPSNCSYHREVGFQHGDSRGVCIHSEVDDRLCEDDLVPNRALHCPHFSHRLGKEQIKEDFQDFLKSASLVEIAAEYPDLAALMWVLQTEHLSDAIADLSEETEPLEPEPSPKFPVEVGEGITLWADNVLMQERALLLWNQQVAPMITVEPHDPFPSWGDWFRWFFRRLTGKKGVSHE